MYDIDLNLLFALQLATVSSAFRSAAQLALQYITGEDSLRLDKEVRLPSRMDSKLLLEWALHSMVRLHLPTAACTFSGMAEFLETSQCLTRLELECDVDMLDVAHADLIVSSCCSIKTLICLGSFVPHHIPATLTALDVDMRYWSDICRLREGCPKGQEAALLFRLARAPGIERLWIRLGWNPQLPALPCLRLHRLRDVKLQFSVMDGPLDLKWLQGQPIDVLHLSIDIAVGTLKAHRKLVQQLKGLTIHRLDVDVHADVELEAQALWGGIVVQEELRIKFYNGRTLVAVPQCKWRQVGICDRAASAKPFKIHWPALSSCPGWVRLDVETSLGDGDLTVEVVGCPGSAPGFSEPWQLNCWTSGRSYVGLSAPSMRRGAHMLLQNLAARSAGWQKHRFFGNPHKVIDYLEGWH